MLPVYRLELGAKQRRKLEQDLWSNEFVEGAVHLDGAVFPARVRYRGHHTRKLPKRSYHLRFPQGGPGGIRELHLNAEFVDPSLMRSKLSFDLFSDLGLLSPGCDPIWLEVDGRAPGVWIAMESVDDIFLRRRGLPTGSIYYAVDGDANFSLISRYSKRIKQKLSQGYEKKYPKDGQWQDLEQFIFQLNTVEDFGGQVGRLLEVEHYLDWLMLVVAVSNTDGFGHNYALYGNSEGGRFDIIPWDYEGSWGRDPFGRPLDARHVPVGGRNSLSARLLRTPRWRAHYARRLLSVLGDGGVFSLARLYERIDRLHERLRPFVHRDKAKGRSSSDFDAEAGFMKHYAERRLRYLVARARTLLRDDTETTAPLRVRA